MNINRVQLKRLQDEIDKLVNRITEKEQAEIERLKQEIKLLNSENVRLKTLLCSENNSNYIRILNCKNNNKPII